ncbi:hypothetical protein Scep_015275 [Stephania cephalantha]|uniref:Conserved oligomeric Golgi complex subunit 4 N-terminal domain-containing protein n=1 Tax=Stephania cephalantha TaxID=152367 RepID=A0AAP0P1B3_9MAGN
MRAMSAGRMRGFDEITTIRWRPRPTTCDLADQVSGKVKELDLAQSNFRSTFARLDAIIERGNCIEGVDQRDGAGGNDGGG